MTEEKPEEKPETSIKVDRLCSEIQLFDLCDREACKMRNGRYCTDEEMLARFEAIKEEDEADSLVYDEDELEDGDDLDGDDMDDYEDGEYEED